MRKPMESIMVGTKLVKFGFDKYGNEIAWYAGDYDLNEDKDSKATENTITAQHITDTINKMVKCGKLLPQSSRIRSSKDPEAETKVVLAETIQLWCETFFKQKIGVKLWEKATDKALILTGVPKLEVNIISPTLMYAALLECRKEQLEEQQTSYGREKEEQKGQGLYASNFPEIGKIVAYHMKYHKQPLLNLPSADSIRDWAKQYGKDAEMVEKNMIQLRVYFCFANHAKRDGTQNPLKMVMGDDGYIQWLSWLKQPRSENRSPRGH